MARLKTDALKPGMILAEDLKHSNGRFLLAKGVTLEPSHLRVLKIWGIEKVEVQDSLWRSPSGDRGEDRPGGAPAGGKIDSEKIPSCQPGPPLLSGDLPHLHPAPGQTDGPRTEWRPSERRDGAGTPLSLRGCEPFSASGKPERSGDSRGRGHRSCLSPQYLSSRSRK